MSAVLTAGLFLSAVGGRVRPLPLAAGGGRDGLGAGGAHLRSGRGAVDHGLGSWGWGEGGRDGGHTDRNTDGVIRE